MTEEQIVKPNFLFEVSWEVCNRLSGIYTVLSTKALSAVETMGDNYVMIGPDFGREGGNPEFIEANTEKSNSWKEKLLAEGVRVKIGNWDIQGKPKVILVDFSSMIARKDEILAKLWESYKIDSIRAGWDYVEPVLFGSAVGKVISTIINSGMIKSDGVVAHFHEWMTATGGLALKEKSPSVATVFTNHATVMGRTIAGNNLPVHSIDGTWNIEELANKYNVISKHTVEKAAANNMDCYTTVSSILAEESELILQKKADCLTPNGFENAFIPTGEEFEKKRAEARQSLINVAELSLGRKFKGDPFIVEISGRFEYKNKGIGEFIDALGQLNTDSTVNREILAYIMVPRWNVGPRPDLQEMIAGGADVNENGSANNLTHILGDFDNDPIVGRLRDRNLLDKGGKVCVMYVPSYLDRFDGIFNKYYYELLIGMDLTVLPSYYEPWGYTPLESIAFGIPTISTDVTGFGRWINSLRDKHDGITVIRRTDANQFEVPGEIRDSIKKYLGMSADELKETMQSSREIAGKLLWKNIYGNYMQAYSIALANMKVRNPQAVIVDGGRSSEQVTFLSEQVNIGSSARWVSFMVNPKIPDRLKPLEELSRNLWWSWNSDARHLWEDIDSELWLKVERNPIALLEMIPSSRIKSLMEDTKYLAKLDKVYNEFKEYMSRPVPKEKPTVAYFSMEYGIHATLKIYSGGLGILAGDYLKEASDKNVPLTAVGLLYRYGYFTQRVSSQGEQEANYEPQDFFKIPVSPVRDDKGEWMTVAIALPGRNVTARIWRCDVGRTKLYLLDTDYEANQAEDRTITHHLYGGDWYNRMKQELLLGIGGIRALNKIGFKADVYHCNEGHAAFIGLERIYDLEQQSALTFSEALEVVRASSLFTTHTPVPAGHDAFVDDIIRQYMSNYPERLKITWEQFLNLGKIHPNDPNEKFSMSVLASNLSQEVNGVSMLHGEVSKDILAHIWPGYLPCELDNIGYVTNGVHFPTWASTEFKNLYVKYFGEKFSYNGEYSKDYWNKVYDIPDQEFWNVKLSLKNRLVKLIKKRLEDPAQFKFDSPSQLIRVSESIRPEVLTIGFARRFATYKRAHLLFTNLERLEAIVNNPQRPVQFVFAGKAHPADKGGQDLIKRIVEVSKMPQFIGKIIFLQNYDIELARRLVQGVDIWMNTPTRPLEASGTSGEKAVMNGTMQFSVLDGWWVEGYKEGAGWALPLENTFQDPHFQDELDAEMIYSMIESEIAPLYYDNREGNLSKAWIQYMKKCVAEIASEFTTDRMMQDYEDRYYNVLAKRHAVMVADNFGEARQLAAWKRRMAQKWSGVHIVDLKAIDISSQEFTVDQKHVLTLSVELNGLRPQDVGVELLRAPQFEAGCENKIKSIGHIQFEFVEMEGTKAKYKLEFAPKESGSYNCTIRAYAKSDKLVHRTDLALVKWA